MSIALEMRVRTAEETMEKQAADIEHLKDAIRAILMREQERTTLRLPQKRREEHPT
jgi:hypothetical protein